VGGPIALVRDGDLIAIDAVAGRLDLEVSEEELARRRTSWIAPANPYQSGVLRKYADQVGPARKGAVTHAGGRRKLSVMRIFSGAAVALACGVVGGAAAGDAVKYKSVDLAFEQGLGAYKSGYYEMAIPRSSRTIAEGSEFDRFFAEFYLARIYSGAGVLTDHARPIGFTRRSPTKMRMPIRRRASRAVRCQGAHRARRYCSADFPILVSEPIPSAPSTICTTRRPSSATRMHIRAGQDLLNGTGVPTMPNAACTICRSDRGGPSGRASLSRRPPLAWVHVKKDERRALALITMAVENAPAHDASGLRTSTKTSSAPPPEDAQTGRRHRRDLAQNVAPNPEAPPQMALGAGDLQPRRACGNGELLDLQSTPSLPARSGDQSARGGKRTAQAIQGNPIASALACTAALSLHPRAAYAAPCSRTTLSFARGSTSSHRRARRRAQGRCARNARLGTRVSQPCEMTTGAEP
jgi:hypothetical protein